MPTKSSPAGDALRELTELLERVAGDWRLLDDLSVADRARFHRAIAAFTSPDPRAIRKRTRTEARERKTAAGRAGMVQGLLQEYALSSQEGVALMCLAEALLRVPDAATRDALARSASARAISP